MGGQQPGDSSKTQKQELVACFPELLSTLGGDCSLCAQRQDEGFARGPRCPAPRSPYRPPTPARA